MADGRQSETVEHTRLRDRRSENEDRDDEHPACVGEAGERVGGAGDTDSTHAQARSSASTPSISASSTSGGNIASSTTSPCQAIKVSPRGGGNSQPSPKMMTAAASATPARP